MARAFTWRVALLYDNERCSFFSSSPFRQKAHKKSHKSSEGFRNLSLSSPASDTFTIDEQINNFDWTLVGLSLLLIH